MHITFEIEKSRKKYQTKNKSTAELLSMREQFILLMNSNCRKEFNRNIKGILEITYHYVNSQPFFCKYNQIKLWNCKINRPYTKWLK